MHSDSRLFARSVVPLEQSPFQSRAEWSPGRIAVEVIGDRPCEFIQPCVEVVDVVQRDGFRSHWQHWAAESKRAVVAQDWSYWIRRLVDAQTAPGTIGRDFW